MSATTAAPDCDVTLRLSPETVEQIEFLAQDRDEIFEEAATRLLCEQAEAEAGRRRGYIYR
ncbi:succinyl-CoA synthetase alpha subunit [Fulvimarina pelagi HTCC2506]|uniref:Succinyl-CoA synthetase alpha subunit n=2 Tax=Fulvimarina pelagi TaxID=217511 RepID=Q0FZF1_9HYPH|nr:hypothetical protein [Fulvimarina pelagi]EAU40327.1 succinyl-CoA synthetase alpha subunit [Fulvimarina pelagi HTCC2506]BAT31364.1 succinyl-CoA synthetase alpha subunit [Fulvimarina pelagi]